MVHMGGWAGLAALKAGIFATARYPAPPAPGGGGGVPASGSAPPPQHNSKLQAFLNGEAKL